MSKKHLNIINCKIEKELTKPFKLKTLYATFPAILKMHFIIWLGKSNKIYNLAESDYFRKWSDQILNGQYLTVQLNTFLKIAFPNVSVCELRLNPETFYKQLRFLILAKIYPVTSQCLDEIRSNINWRDVHIKNVVNNVDISSLRAPWQNRPYTN